MKRISIQRAVRWLFVPIVMAACAHAHDAAAEPAEARATLARALATWERSEAARLGVAIEHHERGTLVWAYGRWTGVPPLDVRGEEPCEAWVTARESALISTAAVPRVAFYAAAGREFLRVRSDDPAARRRSPPGGRAVVAWDVAMPPMGVRSGGWWRAPDERALAADLRRLFDRGPLVQWLTSVPAWRTAESDSGGQRLSAIAVLPDFANWGGALQVEVTVEVRAPDVLASLEVRVRRGAPNEAWDAVSVQPKRGPQPAAFPFAALLPEIPAAQRPKTVTDIAVENGFVDTTYRLRPLFGRTGPELEGFLRRRRAETAAAPR